MRTSCSDISSHMSSKFIKYVQCVFSVSIGPRPELAKSPMDLDCEPGTQIDRHGLHMQILMSAVNKWTMWTMWTWVNSDIYGLFNWCSWPLWRNMPVRSSKMQNFDRPQWAMSCLQGLQISASGRIPGQKLPMNSLPVPRRSDDLPWPGTKMHQDAPRNVFPSTDFYHNHL